MFARFAIKAFFKVLPKQLKNRIPDSIYLKLRYRANMGKRLNLKHPQTFNEKLQWLKLHDRNPRYTMMVDKYEVKKYIAETIGEEYVIPTLGVWERFDDINFDALPNRFVLKCTHDSGSVVVCREKATFDKKAAQTKLEKCLKRNYYYSEREWPYKNVKPRIIAEQYMEDFAKNGLRDYKYFCFNGEPKMILVSEGSENHATSKVSFVDMNGKKMPVERSDYAPFAGEIQMPSNMGQMGAVARKIADMIDSSFVRVDLYSVNNRVYFSEITLTPCAGMTPFKPMEWDKKIGDWITLPDCL